MSGYGISQADMEASRLVFVSVKDARPRRKVAVPVPDGASWESFCRTVQSKLKLRGVDSIYLASSGEQVFRTDELQDIDELYAVEAMPAAVQSSAATATPNGNGTSAAQFGRTTSGSVAAGSLPGVPPASPSHFRTPGAHHMVGVADTEIRPAAEPHHDDEGDEKYIKRNTALKRSLQRVFPSLFQPALPVTARDAKEGTTSSGKQRRRRRGRLLSPRNLLVAFALVSCLGTLLFLYGRLAPGLP